jgi:drug/metabolite transporter (DMT)-like permease
VAVVGVSMAVAVAITVIAVLVFTPGDIGQVPQAVLPWIVAVSVAQFIGSHSLGMVAITLVGASRTFLFIAGQAPFAAFFAIALTGEALRPVVVVGTVGVVAALILASGDTLTQGWRTERRYLAGCLVGLVSGASMGAGTVLAKAVHGHLQLPSGDNIAQYAGSHDYSRAAHGPCRSPQPGQSGHLPGSPWVLSSCAA